MASSVETASDTAVLSRLRRGEGVVNLSMGMSPLIGWVNGGWRVQAWLHLHRLWRILKLIRIEKILVKRFPSWL
jgi:hypothetical protein